jgi:hypothetical protein
MILSALSQHDSCDNIGMEEVEKTIFVKRTKRPYIHVASKAQECIQASTVFNRSFNHALAIHGNRNGPYHHITSTSDLLGSGEKRLFSPPRNSHKSTTTTEVFRRAKADPRTTSAD